MSKECIIHHWRVDPASASLIHQQTGEQRRLGEYQFKLLQMLIEHAGQPLTRDELTALVWERRVIGNNSLPNAIHALRVALEDDGKQQRIIRTLPRKGYILDAGFCTWVNSAEPLREDSDSLAATVERPCLPPAPSASLPAALPLSSARKPAFWRWLVAGQLLLLALVLGWLFSRGSAASRAELVETGSQVYSNIRLIELYRGWEIYSAAEDISSQLEKEFYNLNAQLASHNMRMDVFFYAYGSSLNYTLSLKNSCDHRQLAMNISNWRTDGAQLNALIYRETQRKINEMANCVN